MPTRLCLATAIVGGALVGSARVTAQDGDARASLVTRATAYVAQFEKDFSSVVAEQHQQQRIVKADGTTKRERVVISDVLLVRTGTSSRMFRDVISVDGKPVRDRNERVRKLFLSKSSSASEIEQIRAIAKESSRFDIGLRGAPDMLMLPLRILGPLAGRFTFEPVENGLRFSEIKSPALFRSRMPFGSVRDMFLRGTFALDAEGRVLGASLSAVSADIEFTQEIRYAEDSATTLLVPGESRETLRRAGKPTSDRTEVVSIYSNFRRFQVTTEEQIAAPSSP